MLLDVDVTFQNLIQDVKTKNTQVVSMSVYKNKNYFLIVSVCHNVYGNLASRHTPYISMRHQVCVCSLPSTKINLDFSSLGPEIGRIVSTDKRRVEGKKLMIDRNGDGCHFSSYQTSPGC